MYVFGLPAKEAIASSLLVVATASLSAAVQHARAGNVRLRTAVVFGGAGVVGAYAGGRASALVDGGVLLLLFAAMMMLTAVAMWRGRRRPTRTVPESGRDARLVLQGLAVGSFTGLIGAGGGFLIVPALVLWAGLPMSAAVGTSLVIIVANSMSGFAGYATHVSVDVPLVVAVAACAVAGSFVGSALARAIDPAQARRAFAAFVLAMGGAILVREGALVAETATEALPTTAPQLLFAALMLGIGMAAGRVSRGPSEAVPQETFDEGAGI